MEHVVLEFPIEAVPKGRPRLSRNGHTFTPTRTRDFESAVKSLARHLYKGHVMEGRIAVGLEFHLTRPKKPSKTYPSRSDLDNYCKAVLDSMNEIVWKDDSQIVEIYAMKAYAQIGHGATIRLTVTPLDELDQALLDP